VYTDVAGDTFTARIRLKYDAYDKARNAQTRALDVAEKMGAKGQWYSGQKDEGTLSTFDGKSRSEETSIPEHKLWAAFEQAVEFAEYGISPHVNFGKTSTSTAAAAKPAKRTKRARSKT
jgi:hypothetical protein